MERQLEYGKEVHICFIDYSKAFDCINHELLWKTLLEMGIPKHLIQLLKGLCEDQSAVTRTEFEDTDRFKIKKGVRQGCILFPFLFNLYAERIMRKAEMEEAKERGEAAEHAVDQKSNKYATLPASHEFVPIAVETLGPINREGREFLLELGRCGAVVSGDPRETVFLFQRLSVCIQRFNAVT